MALGDALPYLKAAWTFDEASDTNRLDSIGGHTAVETGTVTSAAGKIGNAAVFPYTNTDWLEAADHADLRTAGVPWMVGGWVNITANVAEYPTLMHKGYGTGTGTDREYIIYIDGGTAKVRFDIRNASNDTSYSLASDDFGGISTGNWYHFVVGVDPGGDKMIVSVNGVRTEAAFTDAQQSGTSPVQFGHTNDGGKLNGALDDFFYLKGYILSDAECEAIYAGGTGLAVAAWAPAAFVARRPFTVRQAVNRASTY